MELVGPRAPCAHSRSPGNQRDRSLTEVIGLQDQVWHQRLILDMGAMLDGVPVPVLFLPHVGAVLRRSGEPDVIGHHDRAAAQPATADDCKQVGQVRVLVVIDE